MINKEKILKYRYLWGAGLMVITVFLFICINRLYLDLFNFNYNPMVFVINNNAAAKPVPSPAGTDFQDVFCQADSQHINFNWDKPSESRQISFRIRIWPDNEPGMIIKDTGVISDSENHFQISTSDLKSGEKYFWQVQLTLEDKKLTPWINGNIFSF